MDSAVATRAIARDRQPDAAGVRGAGDRAGDPRWLVPAALVFLLLGVAVRLVRYLACFPLTGDECFLAVNLLDRDASDLLRPLEYHQVCPALFLWIELGVVRLLGFSELSLRLFPCLASIASVCLFRWLAGRFLRGTALVLAVAVFAVSYYPIRYVAEVKPYGCDLAVSLVLTGLALHWWRDRARTRWLWALVVAAPIGLAMSYPAAFLVGSIGVMIGFGLAVDLRCRQGFRRGFARVWLPAAVYVAVSIATGITVYALFARAQHDDALCSPIGAYWASCFPPLGRPGELVRWLVATHTGHMFAYPAGGGRGGSVLSFVLFFGGVTVLIRRGLTAPLAFLGLPFVLTFSAAALHLYPYGGSTRLAMHLAPAICALTGLGAASLLERAGTRLRCVGTGAVCASLAALGVAVIVLDLVHPYKTEHDRRTRDFARWFWTAQANHGEVACAWTDLREGFFPRRYSWRSMAQYLCNQRIYSARHRNGGGPPRWAAISAEHPLRCVVFSLPGRERDERAFDEWLRRMRANYRWVGFEKHEFHETGERPETHPERIEVYEFIPARRTLGDPPRSEKSR